MEIRIFDVEHGFCAYIVADNRNVILIDCGHNEKTGFRPSWYLPETRCTGIEKFIVSNYDEDHLSDLDNLRAVLPITTLRRNRSVDADQLYRMKAAAGPIQPGMSALLDMIRRYVCDVTNPPDFAGIELAFFCNRYPQFMDTNNLSLVTFLHYQGVHIVFPGDLEKVGWQALAKRQGFQEHLRRVNIYVASHHGRESGYVPDVFSLCKPDVVIVSDDKIKFETQEVDYGKHASGIPDRETGATHYVLSTRKYGHLRIESSGDGYTIHRGG